MPWFEKLSAYGVAKLAAETHASGDPLIELLSRARRRYTKQRELLDRLIREKDFFGYAQLIREAEEEQRRWDELENGRLQKGYPPINTLPLPNRMYNAWVRSGVKTAVGLQERVQAGFIPRNLGIKGLRETTRVLSRLKA